MLRAAIFTLVTLSATTALSSPVATWSGAGPNPCDGRCDMEWAETHLTELELAELNAYRELNPEPYTIFVDDGSVFSLMTYYKDGPIAYRTTTVANLELPEAATGWIVGDWAWIQLHACDNWAILDRTTMTPVSAARPIGHVQTADLFRPVFNNINHNGGFGGSFFEGGGCCGAGSTIIERIIEGDSPQFAGGDTFNFGDIFIDKRKIVSIVQKNIFNTEINIDKSQTTINIIPLPAAAWFLLTGVLALFGIKHLFRRNNATA